jgi:hypothetical protein
MLKVEVQTVGEGSKETKANIPSSRRHGEPEKRLHWNGSPSELYVPLFAAADLEADMFNNEYFIQSLYDREEPSDKEASLVTRERLRSDYCLPLRLPTSSSSRLVLGSRPLTLFAEVLQREGEKSGTREELRQLRRSPSPPLDENDHTTESPTSHQRQRTVSQSSSSSIPTIKKPKPFFKEPPGFQVLRAVETKDIMFLMEVRCVVCRNHRVKSLSAQEIELFT